jgi:hypothetical protein
LGNEKPINPPSPLRGVGLPPLARGEKAESFIEGIQKSSPPFEKGGRDFWECFFKNEIDTKSAIRN